uniref:Uncharacterized protein n=1 Tax=Ascaris lumbricoides TaxID=6252 RepID=A0A0M3IWK9_ASCLU
MLQEEKGISVGRVGGVGMEALITGPKYHLILMWMDVIFTEKVDHYGAVLKDAFLELLIAGTTPDWIGRPPIPDKLESPLIERIEATVPCSSPSAQESAESSPEKFIEESQVAEGGESEADDERSRSPCRLPSQPPRQSPLIARVTQRVVSSEESAKSVAST